MIAAAAIYKHYFRLTISYVTNSPTLWLFTVLSQKLHNDITMKYYNDDLLCVIIICRDIYDIVVFSPARGLAFGSSRACRDVYISEGRWRRRRGVVLHTLLLLYISVAGGCRARTQKTNPLR